MHIEPFGVEIWMNEWETRCDWNLAETCVESLTIAELLEITGRNSSDLTELLPLKMTYGAIEGSRPLREAIAHLYSRQTAENIIVTHGTIGANMLAHRTLVERGDHVISVVPTYQQHHSIPASIGAEVERLRLSEANDWLPDLDQLRAMVRPGTKLIALTNPNNPTGALISEEMLREIVSIARSVDAWILCDEVYRGTDQHGTGTTAAIVDLYEKGISTGGMSKAYSLAGLRLGWIAASRALIEDVMIQRDYDTISVGMIDDHFACLALQNSERLLERSRTITRGNLSVLSRWIEQEPGLSWVRPRSGTTALVKFDLPMSSREFCVALVKDTGVMLTPGSVLGEEGYFRIGYANSPNILKAGLERLSAFLAQHQLRA